MLGFCCLCHFESVGSVDAITAKPVVSAVVDAAVAHPDAVLLVQFPGTNVVFSVLVVQQPKPVVVCEHQKKSGQG